MIFGVLKKHLESNIQVQYMFSSLCSLLKASISGCAVRHITRSLRRRPTPSYRCLQAPALNTETSYNASRFILFSNPAVPFKLTHTTDPTRPRRCFCNNNPDCSWHNIYSLIFVYTIALSDSLSDPSIVTNTCYHIWIGPWFLNLSETTILSFVRSRDIISIEVGTSTLF